MSFLTKIFGNEKDQIPHEFGRTALESIIDEVTSCRSTFCNTHLASVERRMAEEVKLLIGEFEHLLIQANDKADMSLVLDVFHDALFVDDATIVHIEGRIIWVEGIHCKGLQRVIANRFHEQEGWCAELRARLDRHSARALSGDEQAFRHVECYANFLLLSGTDQCRNALREFIATFPDAAVEQIDPLRSIRNALEKDSTTLAGCWDDHWHDD